MKRFYILILLSLIILCKKKDEEPPRVSIISPLNNESFFPDTIEIKVKAEDNEGIDYIEVFVDGILLGRAQRNFATFKWDGTSAPDSSQHTVYAKAIDFAGNIGRSKDVKFFIYSSNHPPSIKLISPDSGSILASNQVTFIFKGKDKDAFDTLFYSIYLDTIPYPIFKEPVVKDLKDTTYTLSNLLYNKKYYWQVVVRDLLGLKDTSKIFFFLTPPLNQKPLPPSNPYPPDGATDVSYTPVLKYYSFDPDGDSIYFRVKLDTSLIFSKPIINILTHDTFYNIINPLISGVKYFWRVTAYDKKGDSSISNLWKFNVKRENLNLIYSISGFWYKDIDVYYDTLFLIKVPNQLEVYYNNSGNLIFINNFTLPSFSYRIYYRKPYLFVTYGNIGPRKLGLFKIQNSNLILLDEFSLSSGAINEVLFYENHIYVILLNGFKILRINSDSFEILNSGTTNFQVLDADIGFNNLYLVGESFIETYSLNSPENPSFLYRTQTGFSGLNNIKIKNRYILVGSNYYLLLYYISDPLLAPIFIQQLPLSENIKIIKNENRLFGIFLNNSALITYPNISEIHLYSNIYYLSNIESGYINYPYFYIVSQNGLYLLLCQK